MTKKEVHKEGAKVFKKIQRHVSCKLKLTTIMFLRLKLCFEFIQFQELEKLGYKAFAIGIHEDSTQLVSTKEVSSIFTPQLTSYLHAVLTAGIYLSIIIAIIKSVTSQLACIHSYCLCINSYLLFISSDYITPPL